MPLLMWDVDISLGIPSQGGISAENLPSDNLIQEFAPELGFSVRLFPVMLCSVPSIFSFGGSCVGLRPSMWLLGKADECGPVSKSLWTH